MIGGDYVEYVKEIFAQYDRQCIRVYQAYNPLIAKEAVLLQTFGKNFNVNRMTWIKPSFLWMMYRSCLLYTSPSPRDRTRSRMPSSA